MIRVLAVDDSALMRRLIAEIFAAEAEFAVYFARDGVEALAALHAVKPDVITLDIHMPQMDGLACLDRIMVERPCPVVMFSTLTDHGTKQTLDALALGAVDFVTKPTGAISLKVGEFGPILVEKVRVAAQARLPLSHRLAERVRLRIGGLDPLFRSAPPTSLPRNKQQVQRRKHLSTFEDTRLVLVGSSTGGPPALDALLRPLPAEFPWPIIVAQHMPASFTGALASRLNRVCNLRVSEVVAPVELRAGRVYIARGDADVIVSQRSTGIVVLPVPSSAQHRWHPSVDRLVDSAVQMLKPTQLTGILMTGMGNDGAESMARLRAIGGCTIAEAEETAVVWGMPGELVRAGGATFVEPLERISARLLALEAQS